MIKIQQFADNHFLWYNDYLKTFRQNYHEVILSLRFPGSFTNSETSISGNLAKLDSGSIMESSDTLASIFKLSLLWNVAPVLSFSV